MIPVKATPGDVLESKPRASGDDPAALAGDLRDGL